MFQLAGREHILSNKVYDGSHDRNIISVYYENGVCVCVRWVQWVL